MGNYIDRDTLNDYVMDTFGGNDIICYKDIIEAINDAPKVDVKTVAHGRWIQYPGCGVTKCSQCGWNIEECWDSLFCPACGATMTGAGIGSTGTV